jgi:hypothetical protein
VLCAGTAVGVEVNWLWIMCSRDGRQKMLKFYVQGWRSQVRRDVLNPGVSGS